MPSGHSSRRLANSSFLPVPDLSLSDNVPQRNHHSNNNSMKGKRKRPLASFPCHPFGKQSVAEKTKTRQWPGGGQKQGDVTKGPTKKSVPQLGLTVLATHGALKRNKEVGVFFKIPFILRKECLVCLLFVFRSILSGERG